MARRGMPANNMPDLILTFICAVLILTGHPGPSSVYALHPPLLPPGGEVRNGEVFHSILKGQSLYLLAGDYLPLTDFYTPASLVEELRDGDEITSPFVHLIFRPSLPDLQTQNPQNSSTIPAVLRFQIEQI